MLSRLFPLPILVTLAMSLSLVLASPVAAIVFDADPAQSTITPPGGSPSPLTGSMRVEIGELPPTTTTTFDVTEAAFASAGYTISLQPIVSPGLGVLSPTGDFLIPTLFLSIDDGASVVDFALPNITGLLLGNGPGCLYEYCLESSFEIDTGGGALIAVDLVAIPEPGTALLVGIGLGALALRGRRAVR
jgi:hypothetical protein